MEDMPFKEILKCKMKNADLGDIGLFFCGIALANCTFMLLLAFLGMFISNICC